MSWRRRRKDSDGGSGKSASRAITSAVGDECEAFLSGQFALHLMATGQLVPTWIGLNRLAHGSVDDVIALSSRPGGNLATTESSAAIAYLADMVLDLAGDEPRRLQALQRDVLIQAELDLAADWFRRREPSEIISTVLAKLEGRSSDGTTRH